MKNILYYVGNFGYNVLPPAYFKWKYKQLRKYEKTLSEKIIQDRINYYIKVNQYFKIPPEAIAIANYKKTKPTGYYLDLKEFLHYFNPHIKFAYHFGDDTHINPYPTLFKARPIETNNSNSILFKLNKRRHYKWINDPYPFSQKKSLMVWRGAAYKDLRRTFIQQFWNHPLCNAGQTNHPPEGVPWQKPKLTIDEQLQYKFILCLEGNDVATSLKWVMSSNSLCLMPKPRFETWFMEGRLENKVHYVELENDYSNLEAIINYYSENQEEAQWIIHNAHQYIQQFQNKELEELLSIKVLEQYALLSGQKNILKFD